MGMNVGDKSGSTMADINVTPLVDVVLVLLIIFMVVTQMLSSGKAVELPDSSTSKGVRDMGQYLVIAMTPPKKEKPIGAERLAFDKAEKDAKELHDPTTQPENFKYPKGSRPQYFADYTPRMWIDMKEVHPWDVAQELDTFLRNAKKDKKKYTDILVKGEKTMKWKDAFPILMDLNQLTLSIYTDEKEFLQIKEKWEVTAADALKNRGKPLLLATEKPKE